MKTVYDYFWYDSSIESIEMEARELVLSVFHDVLQKEVKLLCHDVIGLSNICMWEDTEISNFDLKKVEDVHIPFLQAIYQNHLNAADYDKPIKEDLLDFSVTLTNNMTFHIYCYKVEVSEEI